MTAASPPPGTVDVVLPCLDEAASLPWVLSRLPAGYRAIVADNGSTDGSAELAAAHGATVVAVPQRGFGAAAHGGLEAATAEVVCFCDADGSMDPAQLPRVADPVLAGAADLVLGRRRPVRGAWPVHARMANLALARMLRRRTGLRLHDLGPMRAARREGLLGLDITDRRFGYPLEMVTSAADSGWRITEVDVDYALRTEGTRSKVTGTVLGTVRTVRDMRAVLAQVTAAQLLVITKAPVPGRSKTRLTPPCTPAQAAAIAAASVADTLDAVRAVAGVRRVVALDGPPDALDLDGLVVVPQVDGDLGTRLAAAFAAAVAGSPRPTLLIGMDTPQVTPALLTACLARLVDAGPDGAVLGPASDGGWWALGLHSAEPAAVLPAVPMSRDDTCARTREALAAAGLAVSDLPELTDVDHFDEALSVAAQCPPGSRMRRVVDDVAASLEQIRVTGPLDRILGARLPDPPEALRQGPFRAGSFPSPLHTERRAARVGVWLGAGFVVCFLTGLISHLIQHPPGWFVWPASPSWLYRVTQGTHVAVGLALIPLLLVKLWTVYPRLFAWPPGRTPAQLVARLAVLVLVGSAVMQLATGLINISQWYPFGFFFPTTHYWTGWIAVGAVLVHVGALAPQIRRGLARRGTPAAVVGLSPDDAAEVAAADEASEHGAVSRRAFVATAGLTAGSVALLTWGQTVTPLGAVSVLAPRIPGFGPQGLPVNQTAAGAGVTESAVNPAYRLVVEGPDRLELTLADLRAFPQRDERLPITCVEGWSSNADWTGVRLGDVLAEAGLPRDTEVTVESLQTGGLYRISTVSPPHASSPRTLLALRLNGEELGLDHGYPVRLIAPNRPGVMQTKWITRIAPGSGGVGA